MKRVFLIVLDSCGIGEMPDAKDFSDHDCNTLKRISASPYFSYDNLFKMGNDLPTEERECNYRELYN